MDNDCANISKQKFKHERKVKGSLNLNSTPFTINEEREEDKKIEKSPKCPEKKNSVQTTVKDNSVNPQLLPHKKSTSNSNVNSLQKKANGTNSSIPLYPNQNPILPLFTPTQFYSEGVNQVENTSSHNRSVSFLNMNNGLDQTNPELNPQNNQTQINYSSLPITGQNTQV